MSEEIAFPELQEGVLDEETVTRLFDDLERCTEVLDVLIKGGVARQADRAPIGLRDAQAMFARHEVFGVQVRYRWDGSEWRDTLLRMPEGVRVVRVRMDW